MSYLEASSEPKLESKATSHDLGRTPVCSSNDSKETPINTGITEANSDTSTSKKANVESLPTEQRPQLFIQVCGCVMAALPHLAVGGTFSFSGATIPQLTMENSTDLTLDESSTALFGSLPNMGAIPGSLLAGILTVSVGQRVTLLIVLPLALLCWLGVAFANSVPFLLVARFLLGLTSSILEITPYSYVAEISHEAYRGALSGAIDVMRGVGMMFTYAIGTLDLTWREMALIIPMVTIVPPFIGLLFFHDSPRWLATRGNLAKSSKALQFFRGRKYNIDKEFTDIVTRTQESSPSQNNLLSQFKHFADPSIRKRLASICLLMILWQWGGNNAVLSFASTIFSEADSCSSPYLCSVLIGAGRTIGAIIFLFSNDYIGRRPSFILSSLGCSVCLFALGMYFYIKTYFDYKENLIASLSWLPLVSLLSYTCSISSVIAIQALLPCEILPLSFRLMGKGLIGIFSYAISFSVIQTFLLLKNALSLYGVFWLYAFCFASSSFFPLFLFPETKGKSLEDIESMYKSSKNVK